MESDKAILNAFERLVARGGYEGLTVADVCREAFVSRKTFYHYYKDKEDLFRAVLEHDMVQPVRDLRRLLDVDNLKSATTLMTERAQETLMGKQDFYRQVLRVDSPQTMNICIDMISELNYGIYLGAGLSQEDARFAARTIAAASAYANADWLADGCKRSPSDETRLRVKWFFAHFRELDEDKGRWGEG